VSIKWLVSVLLLAFASFVPCAGAQSLTLTTPDATLTTPDATLTTPDGALGDLSQPPSVGDSTDGLGDATSDTANSATASPRTSPGKAFRTKFDRLPARLETLLERIELGRHERANLKRLQQMLRSLSPRERARLLHLLNAEIRRLRAGGVSPKERRRIERLVRTRRALTAPPAPTPTSDVADAPGGTSETALAPESGARAGEGVLQAHAAASKERPSEPPRPPRRGAGEQPNEGDEGAFTLSPLLIALGAVLLAIIGVLALREERAGYRG
jgi:hypothetical protein